MDLRLFIERPVVHGYIAELRELEDSLKVPGLLAVPGEVFGRSAVPSAGNTAIGGPKNCMHGAAPKGPQKTAEFRGFTPAE